MPDPSPQPFRQGGDWQHTPNQLSEYDVDYIGAILTEAHAGDCTRLIALYRDMLVTHSRLQECLTRRKSAVCCDARNVAINETAPQQDQSAARFIRGQIAALPSWQKACDHLLDSILYPVAVVEKIFTPTQGDHGRTIYTLSELVPVPHELLDHSRGHLRVRASLNTSAESHPIDPHRYIVHRAHSLSTPDACGGPMRSLVFWWFLSVLNRENWARALDKFGAPFLLGRYPGGADDIRTALEHAFGTSMNLQGVVVPREADIELVEARAENGRRKSRSGAQADFHRVANAEIQKLILGHDGDTCFQTETANALQRCDQRRLSNTFRAQLFPQMLQLAGIAGTAPGFLVASKLDARNLATTQALAALKNAGLRVSDKAMPGLSARFGVPVERDARPMHGARTT